MDMRSMVMVMITMGNRATDRACSPRRWLSMLNAAAR